MSARGGHDSWSYLIDSDSNKIYLFLLIFFSLKYKLNNVILMWFTFYNNTQRLQGTNKNTVFDKHTVESKFKLHRVNFCTVFLVVIGFYMQQNY